jgi:O-antigen/teichoic acid export membrane protein
VSWGVTIILARLLSPQEYGLFAMALSVIAFLDLLQQFGLGSAIVQRQDVSPAQLNAAFWMLAGAGSTVVVVAFLAAGAAAQFYGEPRLLWLVRILALNFLVTALGTVPYSLLTKEIDFRRRSLAEACGVIAGAVSSLSLAYLGYGVWALVLGNLARALTQNTGMLILSGWLPGMPASPRGIRDILTFGVRMGGANALNTLTSAASFAIVGRTLGVEALGLYEMADTLGTTNPLHRLSSAVVQQLSLPLFSKLQRDPNQLRTHFLKASKYLAVFALPTQVGMLLVAADLVVVLLSAKWLPMVNLMRAFCAGGILFILPLPSATLLAARGKAEVVLRSTGMYTAIMLAALFLGSRFGLGGVAISWLTAFSLSRLYLLRLSLSEVGIRPSEYVANMSSPLLATAAMGLCVWLVQRLAAPGTDAVLERLLFEVGIGVVVYLALLFVLDRDFGAEVSGLAREVVFVPRG